MLRKSTITQAWQNHLRVDVNICDTSFANQPAFAVTTGYYVQTGVQQPRILFHYIRIQARYVFFRGANNSPLFSWNDITKQLYPRELNVSSPSEAMLPITGIDVAYLSR